MKRWMSGFATCIRRISVALKRAAKVKARLSVRRPSIVRMGNLPGLDWTGRAGGRGSNLETLSQSGIYERGRVIR